MEYKITFTYKGVDEIGYFEKHLDMLMFVDRNLRLESMTKIIIEKVK